MQLHIDSLYRHLHFPPNLLSFFLSYFIKLVTLPLIFVDAWNAQLNPRKRDVRLEHRDCCCCAVGVDVVNPVDGARVSLLAAPLQSCTSHVWTVSLIFQVLLSITIICIVAVQLSDYSYRKDPKDITSTLINYQCLLGTDSQGNSLCIYTYVVSGGSIVLSIVLGLLAVSADGTQSSFLKFICKVDNQAAFSYLNETYKLKVLLLF